MKRDEMIKINHASSNKIQIFEQCGIQDFKRRLQIAMRGMSGNAFAKKVGMSEAVIRDYLSGRTFPSLNRAALIAHFCEVPLEWLVTGKGDPQQQQPEQPSFSKISVYHDDKSKHEPNSKNSAFLPTDYLPFHSAWLENCGYEAQHFTVFWAKGDAMAPTIQHNNALFINRHDQQLRDGFIYLLRYGDYLGVKRIQHGGKNLILLCDNEAYPPINVDLELEADNFTIIGRVIYILKQVG